MLNGRCGSVVMRPYGHVGMRISCHAYMPHCGRVAMGALGHAGMRIYNRSSNRFEGAQ
jgi:hypothetical protein